MNKDSLSLSKGNMGWNQEKEGDEGSEGPLNPRFGIEGFAACAALGMLQIKVKSVAISFQ
jgi:hypothetical protein